VLRSGCRLLRRPSNGRIQCTKDKVKCRALCNDGFQLRGPQVKTCDVETMAWFPGATFACARNIPTPPRRIINSRYLNLNRTNLLLSLRGKIVSIKNFSSSTSKPYYTEITQRHLTTSFPKDTTKDAAISTTKTRTRPLTLTLINETEFFTKSMLSTPPLSYRDSTTAATATSTDFQSITFLKEESTQLTESSTKSEDIDDVKPDLISNLQPKLLKLFNEDSNAASNEPEIQTTSLASVTFSEEAVTTTSTTTTSAIATTTSTTTTTTSSTSSSSLQNRGPINLPQLAFGAVVVGCPTYEGTMTIHSIWRDGFHGTAHFPSLVHPLQGGWLVRVIFSVPLNKLDVFTSDIFAVSQSRQEFALVPKDYNRNVYQVSTKPCDK